MLAALPVIIGVQLLLSFLRYDSSSQPRWPIHRLLGHGGGDRDGSSPASGPIDPSSYDS